MLINKMGLLFQSWDYLINCKILQIFILREGNSRPQMFRGVSTVLTKFFNVTMPDYVFFGQKDIQQCLVVKRLIKDLLWPIKMHIVPTIRERDGLAMSSRNRYLSPQERLDAPILYEALKKGMDEFERLGISDPNAILNAAIGMISKNPRVQLDYLSLSNPKDLSDITSSVNNGAILSGAIRVGKTRIIDNILIGMKIQDL